MTRDEEIDESRRLRESLSLDEDSLMILFMIENGLIPLKVIRIEEKIINL